MTIGSKVNGLIAVLLTLSLGGAVYIAIHLYSPQFEGLLNKGTADFSNILAARVRSEMKAIADRARTLGAASLERFQDVKAQRRFLQDNLSVDSRLIAISLYTRNANGNTPQKKQLQFVPHWRVLHPDYHKDHKLNGEHFKKLEETYPVNLSEVAEGRVQFETAKLAGNMPVIRMGLPFYQDSTGKFTRLLVLEIDQEKLSSVFSESTAYTSYLVDRMGKVLASSNPKTIPLGSRMGKSEIVQKANQKGSRPSQEMLFKDSKGITQIGAYDKVGFADIVVISQIPEARAHKAENELKRQASYLGAALLCFALAMGFLLSTTITRPIKALNKAADRVKVGDFTVRLETRSDTFNKIGDEIQQFSATFNDMVSGLQERDKIKTTFSKFHSKEVVNQLLSGSVELGGERKSAIVFFSDLRGFTRLSEELDPEVLVETLNKYMSTMVRVIIRNGGVVDKYVGDAIMALWGAPISKPDDADRAMKACLEMRSALAELNQEFLHAGKPELYMGMSLNYGSLIAGNIGSSQRMEYTVIGDAVNTASRIESLTKKLGTDLLVSSNVLERVKGRYLTEKALDTQLKGKSERLTIFKVNGYVDSSGTPISITTRYSSFNPEAPYKAEITRSRSASLQPTASLVSSSEFTSTPPAFKHSRTLIPAKTGLTPPPAPKKTQALKKAANPKPAIHEPLADSSPEILRGRPVEPTPVPVDGTNTNTDAFGNPVHTSTFKITQKDIQVQETTLSELISTHGSLDLSDFPIVNEDDDPAA